MMLEEQLRDALDDLVTRVPPRAGLADAVLRQAQRRRAKVRLAAAGGTALAVAAGTVFVVADPLGTLGPDLGTVGPAAGEPADDAPDAPATGPIIVNVDAARLVKGAAPAVPWYADDVLHAGGQEIPFDDVAGFRALDEVAGGVVALIDRPAEDLDADAGHLELLLLSPDGVRTELGSGAIYDVGVSADGTRIAWAEHDWSTETSDNGPGRTLLHVADATTGEVLHEREQTGDDVGMGAVKGFLADGRVVLDNATNGPRGNAIWDPEAGTVTLWTGHGFTNAVASNGHLAVLSPGGDEATPPVGMVDPATGATLWTLPPGHFVGRQAFSPDGALLAVVVHSRPHGLNEGVDRSVVVLDSRTGEPVLTINGTGPGNLVWESADTVLIEARNDEWTTESLVRCSIDGRCEQAAPLHDLTRGELPYLAGGGA